MTTSLNWREPAADTAFTRAEGTQVLARRAGIEALARWAAENFGLDKSARTAYVTSIVTRFLAGANEMDLILRVRSDLERAGKPALSTHADAVYAGAVREASGVVTGRA